MNIIDYFLEWEEHKVSSQEFCVRFSQFFGREIDQYRRKKLTLKDKIIRYMLKEEDK